MANEILCINKLDRNDIYERITYIGGVNADGTRWKITQKDAIAGIKERKYSFYVMKAGHRVNVIVAKSRFGHEYIKTESDGEEPNNLLSLPECK
jgi:hypothetical protein